MLINYPTGSGEFFRSTDQGVSWTPVVPGLKPRKIFSDGGFFFAEKANALYRSTDGLTWTKILQSDFPLSFHDIEARGDTILTAYISESEGNSYLESVLRTTDGGFSWLHPDEGLRSGLFISTIGGLQLIDGYLVASHSHGFSTDEGHTWTRPFAEAGPLTDILRVDDYYFGLKDGLVFYRCLANGRFEWQRITMTVPFGRLFTLNGQLYATDEYSIFRSDDLGATWTPVGTLPPLSSPWAQENFATVNDKIVVTRDSSIFVSPDAGATWMNTQMFPHAVNGSLSRMVSQGGVVLLSYVTEKRVYRSTDDGLTFDTLLTPTNPANPAFRLRSTARAVYLWLGDGQLHISFDQGQNWLSVPEPPGYSLVGDIENIAIDSHAVYVPDNSTFSHCWRLRIDGLQTRTGTVYLDANSNGLRDAGEPGMPDLVVRSAVAPALGRTDGLGRYVITLPVGADTLRLASVPPLFTVEPEYQLTLSAPSAPLAFALQPESDLADLEVDLAATTTFRAGFGNTLVVTLHNRGTVSRSGELRLVLDPLTAFNASEPPVAWQVADTLAWTFADLHPLQHRSFTVEVTTAVAAPGTPVSLAAEAPVPTDAQPADNFMLLDDVISASFDPNDKSVMPNEVPVADVDGRELTYTIRFQNLGNIATDFVVVRDTLSPLLDPATLRPLSASHPYTWTIQANGALHVRFSPIALAPAQVDEPGSHGFVRFAVRPRPGLQIGDNVENTAHIYFDFNPAVVTNTVQTTVVQLVSVLERLRAGGVACVPNPADRSVRLQIDASENTASVLTMWNSQGREQFRQTIRGDRLDVPTATWPPGAYLAYWQCAGRHYFGRLVVHHR